MIATRLTILASFVCALSAASPWMASAARGTDDAGMARSAESPASPAQLTRVAWGASWSADDPSETQPAYRKKNVFLAMIMSAFIPSSGQFYNGEVQKGVLMAALVAGGLTVHFISSEEGDKAVLGDPGLVIAAGAWIWSMFDAPVSAHRINMERARAAGIPQATVPARRWDVYGGVSRDLERGRAGLLVRF
jgi:hypothetical protein